MSRERPRMHFHTFDLLHSTSPVVFLRTADLTLWTGARGFDTEPCSYDMVINLDWRDSSGEPFRVSPFDLSGRPGLAFSAATTGFIAWSPDFDDGVLVNDWVADDDLLALDSLSRGEFGVRNGFFDWWCPEEGEWIGFDSLVDIGSGEPLTFQIRKHFQRGPYRIHRYVRRDAVLWSVSFVFERISQVGDFVPGRKAGRAHPVRKLSRGGKSRI